MRTVFPSEIEDFETECRANGKDPKEFSLEESDITETPPDGPIFTFNGKLLITRIKNNKYKSYVTGNGTHWVADFSDDLRNGFYD